MAKLKLGRITDEKPVKLAVELPASLHRDLLAYGDILGRQEGSVAPEPAKLIVAMVRRFVETDRGFSHARRTSDQIGTTKLLAE